MKSDFSIPIGTPLDRFILTCQHKNPIATGELTQLLRDIAWTGKIINHEVNRAGLKKLEEEIGEENVQGEQQKVLDLMAHHIFLDALKKGGQVCGFCSEEAEEFVDTGNRQAKYVVNTDPLDGSSNTGVNIPIGTIFAIYKRITPIGSPPQKEDFLQVGNKQVAAGYIVYGTSTMLVYTTGQGVNGFTLEPSYGEFILSHASMRSIEGTTVSVNESNCHTFRPGVKDFIEECKTRQFRTYYTGSLIADFHRNMLTGGIYIYPSSAHYPEGKLRLLYESIPLAFIIDQAGGKATDGVNDILEIEPEELHQRSDLFIGSTRLVERVKEHITNA
jgi:fructose-1,6-bisphosphatase I